MKEILKTILFIFCIPTAFVQANTEEIISSIRELGSPFMTVSADSEGGSSREPGIYKRNKDSEWDLVFPGTIMQDAVKGSIVDQLSLTTETGRHESLFLINGQLVVLSIKSSLDNEGSYIIFGQGNHKIVDPFNNYELTLPLIERIEDINVYISPHLSQHNTHQNSYKSQLLVVSIRSDHLLQGEGITFAVILKETSGESLETFTEPILIDFLFHEEDSLKQLVPHYSQEDKDPRVHSQHLIKSFALEASQDPKILLSWKKKLKEDYESSSMVVGGVDQPHTPYYSLIHDRLILNGKLTEQIKKWFIHSNVYLHLTQSYDPISGNAWIHLVEKKMNQKTPIFSLPGFLKENSQEEYLINSQPHPPAPQSHNKNSSRGGFSPLVFAVNDTIYLYESSLSEHWPVEIDRLEEKQQLEKISALLFNNREHDESLLILSLKFEKDSNKKITQVFKIKQSSKRLFIEDKYTISDNFFTLEELKKRTKSTLLGVLFDPSLSGGKEAPSKPYINLNTSSSVTSHEKQKLKWTLAQETESFPLKEEETYYYIFDDYQTILKKHIEKEIPKTSSIIPPVQEDIEHSGIYYLKKGPSKTLSRTKLIAGDFFKDPKNNQSIILNETIINLSTNEEYPYEYMIQIVGQLPKIISSINPQEIRFFALLTQSGQPINSSRTTVLPLFDKTNILASQFNYIFPIVSQSLMKKNIQNSSPAKPAVTFFLGLEPDAHNDRNNGALLAHSIIFKKIPPLTDHIPRQLEAESAFTNLSYKKISQREIENQLLEDQNSRIYWNMGESSDETNSSNKILDLILFDKKELKQIHSRSGPLNPYRVVKMRKMQKKQNETKRTRAGWAEDWRYDNWRRYDKSTSSISGLKEDRQEKKTESLVGSLFPQLNKFLNEVAITPTEKNYAIIVPKSIKPFIHQIIVSTWSDRKANSPFNMKNNKLEMFKFPSDIEDIKQASLRRVLLDIKQEGRRGILYVDIKDTKKLQRPEYTENDRVLDEEQQEDLTEFTISNLSERNPSSDNSEKEDETNEKIFEMDELQEETLHPHVFYWITTGGEKVPLLDLKEWKENKYSKIILASEEEWSSLMQEAELENSYGLSELFQIIRLKEMDFQTQVDWVKSIFEQKAIKKLNLKFNAKNIHRNAQALNNELGLEQLIGYLVNRVISLSDEQNRDPLVSLNRVIRNLRKIILTSSEIRKNRVVDIILMDKVLSKVFAMSLKIENLNENDFLRQLQSHHFFSRLQNEGGYWGNIRNIRKIREIILEQQRKEPIRSVPASFIIYGNSGTGKTKIIKSINETLGIKPYNWKQGNTSTSEESGQFFYLDGSEVTEQNAGDIIAQASRLLTTPEGHRAFFFFDDIHNIDDKPRGELLNFIRRIVDAPGGFIELEDGAEVPTRNLIVVLALNFTEKTKLIEEYQKDKKKEATVEEKIIATLNGEKGKVESSFLKRFAAIIAMESFDAKSLALIHNLAKQARDLFTTGQYVSVSPYVIEDISNAFQHLDARNFLSGAANEIISKADLSLNQSGFKVIAPISKEKNFSQEQFTSSMVQEENEKHIRKYIQENIVALGIEETLDAKLYFLDIVVNSFRSQVFLALWDNIQSQPFFLEESGPGKLLLAWFRQALIDHFSSMPYLPLSALELKAFHFRNKDNFFNQKKFDEKVESLFQSRNKNVKWPDIFRISSGGENYLRLTQLNYVPQLGNHSRDRVNSTYVNKLLEPISLYLQERIRVENIKNFLGKEKNGEWFQNLNKREDRKVREQMAIKLVENYSEYLKDIQDPILREKQTANKQLTKKMLYYDISRMFLYIVDKTISQMPWENVLKFLIQNILQATENISYGNNTVLQNYLFSDITSILRPISTDGFIQNIKSFEESVKISGKKAEKIKSRFENHCLEMLVRPELDKRGN